MRKQGRIARWDGLRGFGFIRGDGGSQDVFFHVRDFQARGRLPVEGMAVVYEEIHVGDKGPHGMAVRPADAPAAAPARSEPGSPAFARRGRQRAATSPRAAVGPMLLLVLAYAGVTIWATATKRMPAPVLPGLALLSALTFFAYWDDKEAAQRRVWRTREQALHLLSVAGGWPGAWFAQQLLRHKNRKPSFQTVYRWTVALHWVGLSIWLIGPAELADGLAVILRR